MFFLLLTLHSATMAVSTEEAVLVFNVRNKNECVQTNQPLILLEDEPLNIRVINSISIYKGQCDDVNGKTITLSNIKNYNQGLQARILQVVSKYGNQWSCSFKSGWTTYTTCNARFHLRTKKPVASISLNNNEIDAKRTSLSITSYDADTQYFFEDGETVIIDCKSLSDLSGSAMMRYFNNTGGTVLETSNYFEDNSFTLRLREEDHANYIDCIYIDKDDKTDVSVTRLVFQLQEANATKSIINLNINGMNVRPSGVEYQHVYHAGEATDITCYTTKDDFLLYLDYNGQRIRSESKVSITLYSNSKTENYSDITCTASLKEFKDVKQTVKVKFIDNSRDFYVTGLYKGKILKKYRESAYSSVIFYEYTNNEMLKLICSKKVKHLVSNKLEWMQNDKSINSSEEIDNCIKKRYLTLLLQASDDNSTIKCVYANQQIAIRLTYKIFDDAELVEMHWILLTASISMVVISVIIIVLIAKHFSSKRNKLQRQPSDTNNANSSGDRTIPHPSQWNEANYTELRESENNEPDYVNNQTIIKKRKAKTKQQKKTSKHHSDSNYENVEYTNRKVDKQPVLNYADVYIANGKKEIMKTSAENYSQVRFTDVNDGSDYVNIGMTQGPSYVNSHAGKQTEPAYCEMQVLQARD